jgi:hypothetical protein
VVIVTVVEGGTSFVTLSYPHSVGLNPQAWALLLRRTNLSGTSNPPNPPPLFSLSLLSSSLLLVPYIPIPLSSLFLPVVFLASSPPLRPVAVARAYRTDSAPKSLREKICLTHVIDNRLLFAPGSPSFSSFVPSTVNREELTQKTPRASRSSNPLRDNLLPFCEGHASHLSSRVGRR